jgi:hypothetical protein
VHETAFLREAGTKKAYRNLDAGTKRFRWTTPVLPRRPAVLRECYLQIDYAGFRRCAARGSLC